MIQFRQHDCRRHDRPAPHAWAIVGDEAARRLAAHTESDIAMSDETYDDSAALEPGDEADDGDLGDGGKTKGGWVDPEPIP